VARTIAIVGAGMAGLSTAHVLTELGFDVTVFDKESEVGGVWTASRRYPGLTTQNVRSTYCFSDFPYPRRYPQWPTGEQVQAYLENYVDFAGLRDKIELDTPVTFARQDPGTGRWTVTTDRLGPLQFDVLVICNGIYSDPFIPEFPGSEQFLAAGGRICHTVDFHDPQEASGKHVLVVGYGKSSCDVANSLVGTAASTTVVARHVIWKIPRKIGNVLNFKWLLLTRLGENLFPYHRLRGMEQFLHGAGSPVRNGMIGSLQSMIAKQLELRKLGLLPEQPLETIVHGTVSLVTPGFFENLAAGKLRVERDTQLIKLEPGTATLGTGVTVPADVIICGTGFHQRVPFLEEAVQSAVTDDEGNFRLYRQVLPTRVTNLAFNGYNSSFLSQLNAEISAVWLGAYLLGELELPPAEQREAAITERQHWVHQRTAGGNACKGTNIVPFSTHNIDELLSDIDLSAGRLARFAEWFAPINPRHYRRALTRLKKRASVPTPITARDRP
jgi:cation diffusion facilitator CzcD-associated flavoprotein CzcO